MQNCWDQRIHIRRGRSEYATFKEACLVGWNSKGGEQSAEASGPHGSQMVGNGQ